MRFNYEVYNKIYHPAPEAAPQPVKAHLEQPKAKEPEPEDLKEEQATEAPEEAPEPEAPEETPEGEEGENGGGDS